MKISDIMTTNVVAVFPDTSIMQIARLLSQHKIHGVPVVEGKKLVGIITETDFFTKDIAEIHLPTFIRLANESKIKRNFFGKDDEVDSVVSTTAKDIMTSDCITINPESDVDELILLVKYKDVHTVPVTIDNTIVGIVTVADIMKLI